MEKTGNSIKKVPLRETNVIQDYLDGMAIKDLAEKYECTHQNVSQFLKKNGIKVEKRIKTITPYTINEHWLDELKKKKKWYFLGFFYADGINSVNKNQIRVKLNIKDIDRLNLFKEWFNSNRPLLPLDKDGEIKTYQGCKELALTSKYLCDRLTELGAPENKTKILKFPDFVPDDMMNHFIRGYFDGDGNITVINNQNSVRGNITIVSSIDFCLRLKEYLENKLGISTNFQNKETYGRVQIEKNNHIKVFLDWLYRDANCYMKRKYDDYIKFINGRDFSIETSYEKRDRINKDKDIIVERYLNGETATKISEDYECTIMTMTRHLKKWGVEIRKNVPPKRTKKK